MLYGAKSECTFSGFWFHFLAKVLAPADERGGGESGRLWRRCRRAGGKGKNERERGVVWTLALRMRGEKGGA
jgi:hypothetical protein